MSARWLRAGNASALAHLVATGGGEAANRLAQIVVVALAAQALGAEGLGMVGIAWSLTAVALALIQGGPDLIGVRELGLGDGAAHAPDRVIVAVTRLKLGLWVLAVPVLLAALLLLGHTSGAALRQLAGQAVAMGLLAAGYAWALRGLGRPFEQGLVRVVQAVALVGAFALLVAAWRDPLAVPVAEAVAALIALLLARRRLGALARGAAPSTAELRGLAGPSLHLGVNGLASTLGWMAPLIAAAPWLPVADVGLLTGVLRLMLGGIGVMQLGFQALFPVMTRIGAVDPARGCAATLALTVHATLATLGWVVILAGLAPFLLPALLGDHFTAAVPLFQWLLPVLLPVALSSPVSYALMARGETRLVAHVGVAGGVAVALACAGAFLWAPALSSVLVLHPVIWTHAAVILAVGLRRGVIGCGRDGWRRVLNPGRIGDLLRVE